MSGDTETLRIVLVDDDAIDREMLRRSLSRSEVEVEITEAADGVAALELLRGSGDAGPLERPYLVLLDLNMPRMNGLEFLAELRTDSCLRHVPVFVLTTSAAPQDFDRAHALGIAGYMVKSVAMRTRDALVGLLTAYSRIVTLSA